MFKRYYDIAKEYFSLGANKKIYLVFLYITSVLSNVTILLLPYFASLIVKHVTVGDYNNAFLSLIFLTLSFVIYTLSYHFNYVAYALDANYTHNILQQKVMKKVTFFDENFSKDISTSFLINTAFNDIGKVQCIPDLIFDSLNYSLSVLISIVILFKVNIFMGIFTIVLSLLNLYLVTKNMKKRDYYLSLQRKSQDKISSLLGQVMDGNTEIKTFNMDSHITEYLEDYKSEWKSVYVLKRKYNDIVSVILPMLLGIGKIFIYCFSIFLIIGGHYDVSMLILSIGYYDEVVSKNKNLYKKLNDLGSYSVRIRRIAKILNYKTSNMLEFGKNANDDIYGYISFDNVNFTYENKQTLKNVSFDITPNTLTAIVGKSGSGKSTIFRLLLRLYKATSGNITIDGVDIYEYSQDVYSSNVSIVTQKPFIFDMSIRENLNLVDSNKDNQVAACKRVGIHDFIMSLPDGYNTKLTKNAENISSGQKQLIALARTLLSKSEILLFDEVTSNLDIATSKHIMKILNGLKKDHTILMITHKPQLMKIADDIIVIDNGKLVGRGMHSELMETNKYYQILQK